MSGQIESLLESLLEEQSQTSQLLTQLSKILQEQQKTNELLAALVDALADDGGDPDEAPARYMDGTPVRG